MTTRDPRAGESDGVDYHFIEDFAFQVMKEQDRFLVSYQVRRRGRVISMHIFASESLPANGWVAPHCS